jgi:protein-disulfide isomerase
MTPRSRARLIITCLVALLLAAACGGGDATVAPAAPPQVPIVEVAAPTADVAVARGDDPPIEDGDPGPVPVNASDPWRGRSDAPVTIVEFGDFQCPFCARAAATIAELRDAYGPAKLRFVWKQQPLPFHPNAKPAALVSMALFEQKGNDGFWRAYDAFYGDQPHLKDLTEDAANAAGTSVEDVLSGPTWARVRDKLARDLALAQRIGVNGTPAFFVNGVLLSGAQPYEKFAEVIDEQLVKAAGLVAKGTPPRRVYAELTKAQKGAAPPPSTTPSKPAAPEKPQRVPVGSSPVRGKATALVTIVEFADFQCPFCGRVEPTLTQLETEYGDKIRLVFKQNPLPFHPRAAPAAHFALEARAQRGDRGFWAAHDMLFAKECQGSPNVHDRQTCMDGGGTWVDHQTQIEDADLLRYAKALGLDVARVSAALATKKHAAPIADDVQLGEDVSASGTPHFFINGRRLVGAQPIETFRATIDEEMAKAAESIKQGVPAAKVYERLQAALPVAGLQIERRNVPAPTKAQPSRGPANAKVVVQVFSDFQCPFCERAMPTLVEVEKAFPGKVRVVWRNLPLPFHKDAELAAEAALEAFHQKGDGGFWAMADALYANRTGSGLERPALETYASRLGLDMTHFTSALDASVHRAAVEADGKLASDAKITGTPTFLVNGYVIVGAQPFAHFKRVVERALAEAK